MLDSPPLHKRRSWFTLATALGFLFTALFSLYFEFQTRQVTKKIVDIESKKASLSLPLFGTTTSVLDVLSTALLVKSELQKIENSQFNWSKIIDKIENTIPKQKGTNEPIVQFSSYSGSAEGGVTINAVTLRSSLDPFADVALLIRAFSVDPAFTNVFVPSITKSLASDGSIILNFSVHFNYKEKKF